MPRQVHKLLGKGTYGKVYKVQRECDDKFYALKEMDLTSMSQSERNDAVNEVRILVSVSHPSVVRLLHPGQFGSCHVSGLHACAYWPPVAQLTA